MEGYFDTINHPHEEFINMTKEDIHKHMRKQDTEQWEIELQEKKSLKMYREEKTKIGYEQCYGNDRSSKYLARARTNSLKLGDWYGRIKRKNKRKDCLLCGKDLETFEHFIMECQEYDHIRPQTWKELREENGPDIATRMILFRKKQWVSMVWIWRNCGNTGFIRKYLLEEDELK